MSTYGQAAGTGLDIFSPQQTEQPDEYKELDASEVITRWTLADQYLVRDRSSYDLNQHFALGEQWVFPQGRSIQEIVASSVTEEQSRTTIDKFGPRTRSLLARLAPNALSFESQPDGLADTDRAHARTREQILLGEHHQQDWEEVREDNLVNVMYGGTSAISVEWDPNAESDPDDSVTDPFTSFTYPSGQVRLTPMSISEFSLQPGVRRQSDALWWVRCTGLPPSVVRDFYRLAKEPTADAMTVVGARQRSMQNSLYGGSHAANRATAVYVFYERPCSYSPGQIVHVVNGAVVRREPWNFPFKGLNLYVFRAGRYMGRWTGSTLLNTARICQWSINLMRSSILEHARKASNVRLMVPEGSVDDDDQFNDDPGGIVRYSPIDGHEPHYQEAPQVARWMSQEADRLGVDMDDIFHTHDVTRGQAPGDRNSGLALSILAEKDDTPLTFIAGDQAKGWARISEMVLMLMAQRRQQGSTTIFQNGAPLQVAWTAEDIGTNPRITVPRDATMPHSKVATQASLTNLFATLPQLAGQIDAVGLMRFLGMSDPEQYAATLDRDASLAQWENQLLTQSVPIAPMEYNNHAVHIVEHNGERNTPGFQMLPPDRQQAMQAHVEAHQALADEEAATKLRAEMTAPGLSELPSATAAPGSATDVPSEEEQLAAAALPTGGLPGPPAPGGLPVPAAAAPQ